MFTSRFVDAGGLRQHVVVGGQGPPLLLIHGWPQTWYAWRMVMPALAREFQVIVPDQRGMGLTDKPQDGYDTATLARDLIALMDSLGHQRFAVFGTDTGLLIGYALAADFPDAVERLIVSEAPLFGVAPSAPLVGSGRANDRLWHIPFNRTDGINEELVQGREAIFFNWQYDSKAVRKLPDHAKKVYVDSFAANRDALRGSFGFYRALDDTIAQNEQRQNRRLSIPVMGIGGERSLGEVIGNSMKLVADNVQTVSIPNAGHWIAEEAPEDVLAAVTSFLAPVRTGR
jgi:pimeloyl-ACP methyl ester carboxylesterase